MEYNPYPLIEDEEPEKESSLTSHNSEQTPGENIEEKKEFRIQRIVNNRLPVLR